MKNLRLAIPLSFISMLFFPIATWMFFYTQYLSFQQIATILGVGAMVSLLAEIPTGVFADMVGRKWAITLSYFLFTVSMIGVAFSTTYMAFLIWGVVGSLVNSLYSGSMEALLYDTLKERGEEETFDVWTSRMESVTWIGLFVSAVIGGYLYSVDPKFPYYAQAVMTFVATILAFALVEPRIDSTKYHLGDIWNKNLQGFRELFANKKIRYLTSLFTVIGLGYFVAADILGLSQLLEYQLHTQAAGWILGVGYIISALASHVYPAIRKWGGEMRLVWLSTVALIISFVLAKYVGVGAGVGLIILRISSSTTFRNSRSVIINREISSNNRATTLSTLNLLTELPYALTAGIIGGYMDHTSPNQFAWMVGVGIMVALVIIQFARAASIRERR